MTCVLMYMYNINLRELHAVVGKEKTTSNAVAKKQGGRLEFSSAKKTTNDEI